MCGCVCLFVCFIIISSSSSSISIKQITQQRFANGDIRIKGMVTAIGQHLYFWIMCSLQCTNKLLMCWNFAILFCSSVVFSGSNVGDNY